MNMSRNWNQIITNGGGSYNDSITVSSVADRQPRVPSRRTLLPSKFCSFGAELQHAAHHALTLAKRREAFGQVEFTRVE